MLNVQRAQIFNEFSFEEQKKYFALKEKKVTHHIDTLYYSVSIKDDVVDNKDAGVIGLCGMLAEAKEKKQLDPSLELDFFGLDVSVTGFSIYQYHLLLNENFDIFIAKNIPNEETPRVCVQLRSRMLVLDGVCKAIEKSYYCVKEILGAFGLEPGEVRENRIDYAFHTNIIQNSIDYFSDEYLLQHLKSQMRLFHKIGNISDTVEINTLQLGNRKSNNIFFRAYNKTREVIEKNYKSFFFDKWLDDGLINQYDYYVLNKAFEKKSFKMGLAIGRMEWYIEFGKNEALKTEFNSLIESCYVNSDNLDAVEKKIKGVLPKVTIVTNIEFQTKRRFYTSCEQFIKDHVFEFKGDAELYRLYKILSLQREFCDYLTSKAVCFVDNKGQKSEKMSAWWQAVHRCKIEYCLPSVLELYRDKDRAADVRRSKRKLMNCIAQYNILLKNDIGERTFSEDASDALAYLNDNDFYGFANSPNGQAPIIYNSEYEYIQKRKARQYRGVIKEKNEKEEEENESNS